MNTRIWAVLLLGGMLSAPGAPASGAPAVDFSFEHAELRMIIRLVGETTGRRFVVHEAVTGRVTVVSPGPLPADRMYPLLLSILESRGYAVVERDGHHFVVPVPGHPLALAPALDGEPGGLETRVFQVRNVDAADVARAIEPLVRGAKEGMLSVFAPSGHLIVTDLEANLGRIARILEELDRPGAARTLEVVSLEHASAEDLAEQVSAALSGAARAGTRVSRHVRQVAEGAAALPAEALVVPAAHANRLVLVGAPPQIAELKRLIALLDVEPPSGYGRWNAIFLRYLSAEEAAQSLNALLARGAPKDQAQRIGIEASVASNALLVDATPRDFQWIRDLVDGLDRMPQQVMIEILIAEVTLDTQLDLGVEWATVEEPGGGRTTVLGRSAPGETEAVLDAITRGILPRGMTLGVARGVDAQGRPRIPFLLQALQQDRDVRILSSVPLWAQNNTEASVSVVDNIPLLRSTIEGGAGVTRDVIQNIDRVDVGIKLTVTPHVNPERQITLRLNPSIEAILSPGPADIRFAPTIAKREVSTTVTVPDRATVVISGLIREDRYQQAGRIPLLGDIPFLGALFRYTTEQTRRSNLLIFVTPSLVTDPQEAALLREELEGRADLSGPAPGSVPGEP